MTAGLANVSEALAVVKTARWAGTTMPPYLAAQLPNIMRCLQMLEAFIKAADKTERKKASSDLALRDDGLDVPHGKARK